MTSPSGPALGPPATKVHGARLDADAPSPIRAAAVHPIGAFRRHTPATPHHPTARNRGRQSSLQPHARPAEPAPTGPVRIVTPNRALHRRRRTAFPQLRAPLS